MDEFDKIRELTEGLTQRREPSFTSFSTPAPTVNPQQVRQQMENNDVSAPPFQLDIVKEEESIPDNNQSPTVNFNVSPSDEIKFVNINDSVEEKSFPSLKIHLILLSVLIVVLGISLFGFYVYKLDEDDSEIMTITAQPEIIKEAPLAAGGMNIPDQDKLVYNRIRSDNVATKVESLFPEPEKPVLPQILAIEQNAPDQPFVNMDEVKPIDPLTMVAEKKVEPIIEPEPVPATIVSQKDTEKEVIIPQKEEKVVVNEPVKEVAKTEPVVEKQEPLQVVVINESPKKEVITLPLERKEVVVKQKKPKETWRVQLFASNNKDAVENAWKGIQKKHVKLLSNMSYHIKKVEIPNRGAFYRLHVGQFPSREMAEGLCSKLKAKKQDCIPVK